MEDDWSLTIDTSGPGRTEWLEEQEKDKQAGFRKTSAQVVINSSGRFRYRAKVDDARGYKVGRWAWDVFLVTGP